jgi:hypothetical protein
MNAIVKEAALVLTIAGLAVGGLTLARTRQIPLSLSVLLDFFVAAGLLRLVGPPTWPTLATAALGLTVRQVANRGLRVAKTARYGSHSAQSRS